MRILLWVMPLILLCACANMRDHAGKRGGAFTLYSKTHFGPGEVSKDYCMVTPEAAVTVGDTKNEVIKKIGLPDAVDRRGDGVELWHYKYYGVELGFKEEKMVSWKKLPAGR